MQNPPNANGNDDVDNLAANLQDMHVGEQEQWQRRPLSLEEERDPEVMRGMVDGKSRKGLHNIYSDHHECLTCRRVFGTRKELKRHLKKRAHYQGHKLQGDIEDFTEDMEEKHDVDLQDVPLTSFISVMELDPYEQQHVRRLLLDRAKLKHF